LKIQRSRLGTRILATVFGIGVFAFGAFSYTVRGAAPDAYLADRALWMGLTFMFAGVCAITVSWLVADLSNIWCRPPRRSGFK